MTEPDDWKDDSWVPNGAIDVILHNPVFFVVGMLAVFGLGCCTGMVASAKAVLEIQDDARKAGVGCVDPETGDFVFDESCPDSLDRKGKP